MDFPLSRTLQFRDANLEVASLVNPPTDFDGVLVGKDGRVRALWSSFATEGARDTVQVNRGMPADTGARGRSTRRASGKPLYSLETEFDAIPIAAARKLGLPRGVGRALRGAQSRRIGRCSRSLAWRPASAGREGAAARRPAARGEWQDARTASAKSNWRRRRRACTLTVLRDGVEKIVDVGTAALRGEDIDRLLLWAGAVLHAPHRAMSIQRAIPPEGVFVAYFAYGSPATRYKLFAGRRIVEVDGQPTPDLDAFIAAVKGREDRSSVRLQDRHLERLGRRHHAEARPALLADVRTATHARWLGAPAIP